MNKHHCIVWFRQDLRVQDNPALNYAVAKGAILPIYIYDDQHPERWQMGSASRWWLHHSLQALNHSLEHRLKLFIGDPLSIIPEIIERTGIDSIVWNRCYQPWQISRDSALKQKLIDKCIEVKSFNGSLLWEPWTVLKQDGTPYKVFTPYYRKGCLALPAPRFPESKTSEIQYFQTSLDSLEIDQLGLMPQTHWYKKIASLWQPGERGAAHRLRHFLQENICNYQESRDVPGLASTSRLSPHLRFGEVSPNQVWYAAMGASISATAHQSLDCFLSELVWREFSYYLLFHFPSLPEENFQKKFNRFSWKQDERALAKWQQGATGIPIVDAGMRELWQTGYMHNRVRMIVGSFLVKNLLLHWHCGARWFWDCLLDADLANNSASWQWVAGSGADAAPYFRIFNPVSQGEKFDGDGVYVRKYCPEISALPNKFIHKPWAADKQTLSQAKLVLGKDYPNPMVDLKVTRQRALEVFAQLKKDREFAST